MSTIQVDLEEELVQELKQVNPSAPAAVRELALMELYRRGVLSSGRAAEWLGMSKEHFLTVAADAGIPYFVLTEDEWRTERARVETL